LQIAPTTGTKKLIFNKIKLKNIRFKL
jgi:hypothetical protein